MHALSLSLSLSPSLRSGFQSQLSDSGQRARATTFPLISPTKNQPEAAFYLFARNDLPSSLFLSFSLSLSLSLSPLSPLLSFSLSLSLAHSLSLLLSLSRRRLESHPSKNILFYQCFQMVFHEPVPRELAHEQSSNLL
jgi:hypothetical protein